MLGLDSIASDPRFADNAERVSSRKELFAALSQPFSRRSRESILQQLEAQGIPAGPNNTVADVFSDPHVQHHAMRLELDAEHVLGNTVPGARTPPRFSDSALAVGRPSPRVGDHDSAVQHEP